MGLEGERRNAQERKYGVGLNILFGGSMTNKGNLIQKEKEKIYKREKREGIEGIIILLACNCLFITAFISQILSTGFSPWALLFMIFIIIIFSFCMYIYYLFPTRVRMEVYENGFIPPNRPMEYYKEEKELFISWKDIIDMRRKDFLGNPQKWFYHIKIRNEYVEEMIFGHTLFDDGDREF